MDDMEHWDGPDNLDGQDNITVEIIREFLVLAETKNFLQAAEDLFVSQPSLSRHIMQLEKNLGLPLFKRTTRTIELTKAGARLLPYAQRMTKVYEECNAAFAQKAKDINGKLTIGVFPGIAAYNISDPIGSFAKEYPKIEIDSVEHESCTLKKMVSSGECDFAFVLGVHGDPAGEFAKLRFAEDVLSALMSSEHPLAKEKSVSFDQIQNEGFLLPLKNGDLHKICTYAFKKAGFSPKIAPYKTTGRVNIGLVGQGLCITLHLKKNATYLCRSNTIVMDIKPTTKVYIDLIFRKDMASAAGNNFLKYIRSYIDRTRE